MIETRIHVEDLSRFVARGINAFGRYEPPVLDVFVHQAATAEQRDATVARFVAHLTAIEQDGGAR